MFRPFTNTMPHADEHVLWFGPGTLVDAGSITLCRYSRCYKKQRSYLCSLRTEKIMIRVKKQWLRNSMTVNEASTAIKGRKHHFMSGPVPRLGLNTLHCTCQHFKHRRNPTDYLWRVAFWCKEHQLETHRQMYSFLSYWGINFLWLQVRLFTPYQMNSLIAWRSHSFLDFIVTCDLEVIYENVHYKVEILLKASLLKDQSQCPLRGESFTHMPKKLML